MMVDLHSHVLPLMDDGATSLEMTYEMLSCMVGDGVSCAVATPHFDFKTQDKNEFISKREASLKLVRDMIVDKNLSIKVLSGVELMYSPQLANEDLDPFTIEGTDYVLIELSTQYDDPSVFSTLRSIVANGYIPILAHVERYTYLIEDSQRLVDLVNLGVITQINCGSINNERYPFVQALFKHNLAHLIASDAHNMGKRKPNLRKDLVDNKIYRNSNLVIDNDLVDMAKPSKIKKLFNKYY